jgi:hypothetical protein
VGFDGGTIKGDASLEPLVELILCAILVIPKFNGKQKKKKKKLLDLI